MAGLPVRRLSVSFLAGLLIALGLFYSIGFREVTAVLLGMNMEYFWYALLVNLAGLLLGALKLWYVSGERVALSAASLISLSGVFVNLITPAARSGGEAVKAYFISKKSGMRRREALALSVADSYFLFLVFLLFGVLSFGAVLFYWSLPHALFVVIAGAFAIFILLSIPGLLLFFNKRFGIYFVHNIALRVMSVIYHMRLVKALHSKYKSVDTLERGLRNFVEDFFDSLSIIADNRRLVAVSVFLSALIYLTLVLRAYYVIEGFGFHVPVLKILMVVTISELVGILSFLPGGLGMVELSLVGLLNAIGINAVSGVAITLVDRFISYWVTLVVSFAGFWYLWKKLGKKSFIS